MIRFRHTLILLTFILAHSAAVFACSCMGGDGPACQETWRDGVKSVFLARVTKIEIFKGTMGAPENALSMTMGSSTKRVSMRIEQGFLGMAGESAEVFTAASEAACGYPFQEGQEYLVFAAGQGQQLTVSLCSATRLAKYAAEDISYMKSLLSLPATARVYGTMKRYTYDPNFKPTFEPSIMDHFRPPEETYRAMSPMKGMHLHIQAADGDHEAIVDETGAWGVSGLPAGRYEIKVDLPKNLILDPAFGIKGDLSPKGCSRIDLRAESNGHLRGHITSETPLSQYYLAQVGVFRATDTEIDLIRPFSEVFPDWATGDFDIGPLPPGRYYLAVILDNKDLDIATVFYPNENSISSAKVISLGDGESKSQLDFAVVKPVFRERPSCCEFKIHVPSPSKSRYVGKPVRFLSPK